MSILGTLTLDLTAPTAQLSRDLERAHQMAREAASKMGGVKPIWGIASSLGAELKASRSILNSSLKAMESDASGYTPSVQVGVTLDALDNDNWIKSLEENFRSSVGDLNSLVITPRVDDSQLTALNKHLSLKEEHLDRVVSKFDRDKITPGFQTGNSGATLDKIGGSLSTAVDAALSPLKSVGRGVFEDLGKQLTSSLSKGLADSLNAAMSETIGSQGLLGEKIGEIITGKIKTKIGKSLGREITDLSAEVLGQENIDREGGAIRSSRAKSKDRSTQIAVNQLNTERQQATKQQYTDIADLESTRALRSRVGAAESLGAQELADKQSKLLDVESQKPSPDLISDPFGGGSGEGRLHASRVERLKKEVEEATAELDSIQVLAADLDAKIPELQAKIEANKQKRNQLTERIDILDPEEDKTYRKIAEDAAGRKLKKSEIPSVIVADEALKKIGARATYQEEGNLMYVTSELDRQARSNKLTGQNQETLYHENIHAVDLGFGSIEGVRAGKNGEILTDRRLTAEEVAFAAPTVAKYAPLQRAAEMSAYGMQYRNREVFAAQDRKLALSEFQKSENYGVAGERFKQFAAKSGDSQKSELGNLINVLPSEDIKELIQIRAQIKSRTEKIIKDVNQSVASGQLADGLESAIDSNIAEIEQFDRLLQLSKTKANKAKSKEPEKKESLLAKSKEPEKKESLLAKIGQTSSAISEEFQLSSLAFGEAIKRTKQASGQFGILAGKIINPVASVASKGYQIAQGVENAVLPMIPFGREIKSVGKNIALPSAASTFGGVPMLGGAITSASTALAGSVAEGAITMLTPILAGKAALNLVSKGAKLALPPNRQPEYNYIEAGETVAKKAIGATQGLVKTEYSKLPPERQKLQLGSSTASPQIAPSSDADFRPAGRNYIVGIRQKLDAAISSGNKVLSQKLYGQFDTEVDKFKSFIEGIGGDKQSKITNQAVIGKWEKVKADRARKIEQIDDDDLNNMFRQIDDDNLNNMFRQIAPGDPIDPSPPNKPSIGKSPLGKPVAPPSRSKKTYNSRFNPQSDGAIPIPEIGKRERDLSNDILYQVSPAAYRFDRAYSRANKNIDKRMSVASQGINSEATRIADGDPSKISPASSAMDKLVGVGKLALGTFGAFSALSLGVPAMISLGKSTLETAKNFETLQVKLAAASDSAQSGKNSFKRISSVADDLGISRSSALEVGAGISGTTFGTELEGKPTDRLMDQTLEFFKLRGLSNQQQQGFQLAATQTLGRKNVSMQEVNQFIQSAGITDTRSIAARGLGMTPAQFAAAADTTGIDAKKFYSAFISQGLQDSRTGEGLASQTAQYKESKLSAKTERLAGNVGEVATPVYKAGIDLLTNSIGLLVSAIENGKSVLLGFASYGLTLATVELIKLAKGFDLLGKMAATSKMITLASVGSMTASIVKLGATLAAFYILGEGIQSLGKKWSNAGQEIKDGADKVANALAKINKNQAPNLNNPSNAALAWSDSPVDNFALYLQRGISVPAAESLQKAGLIDKNVEILDNKQKADQEIIREGEGVTTQVINAKLAGIDVKNKGKLIENVDRELAAIDTERSGLYSSGAPDADKIDALNKRYQQKTKDRDKLNEEVAPVKTAAQEAINAVKGQQAFLDNNRGKIGEDTYLSQSARSAGDLKVAEATLAQINKDLKSSFDTLSKWTNTLDKISAKFEKIGTQANTSREQLATNRNLGEISGRLTRGGSERQSVIDSDRVTSEEIKQRKLVLRELKDSLNILDKDNVSRVQTSYELNDNSSVSEINVAKNRATDDKDKTTLEKLATIKEEQIKIATLDAGLSNSHRETYQRIYQENREAALYYVSLAQQIDPKGAAFQKNISAISTEKNRFMMKLNNYGTGGFDVYTNAVLELMDLAKESMTAQAKRASDQKAVLDAATNRDNDIAGKRQNAFDVTPGAMQPAVGQVSSSSQKAAQPQPQPQPQPNVQPPAPNAATIEPPLPPKTIKVKRTKTFTDKNGYTDSSNPQIQAQIRAQLANGGTGIYNDKGERISTEKFKPSDIDRYLNSTKAIGSQDRDVNGKVTGYTDLGFDDFDRKYLGAPKKPGDKWGVPRSTVDGRPLRAIGSEMGSEPKAPDIRSRKSKNAQITVVYEEEVANPEYKKAVEQRKKAVAASKGQYPSTQSQTSKQPQSNKPNQNGKMTTTDWLDKQQGASGQITQQGIDKTVSEFGESESGRILKAKQIKETLERKSRLALQDADKFNADRELANLNAIPAVSIQDTQQRETLAQTNSLKENRNTIVNQRIDMGYQISSVETSIDEFNRLVDKPNKTQGDNETLQNLQKILPKLAADLPRMQAQYARLRAIEAELPANDAKAVEALRNNQKYQLETAKEKEEQDRRALERTAISNKLTDIDQQLTNSPLDQDKLKSQRQLNVEGIKKDAQIARINADRQVTDRARTDATYYPKQQAADRKRNADIEANTIKNAVNKQSQQSVRDSETAQKESLGNRIAETKLSQQGGDLDIRKQQSLDKIDAPYANTRAIEMELRQKLKAIDVAKIERDKGFDELRIKFRGDSAYNKEQLASIDRQQKEADRQSQAEKSIVETDSGIAIQASQKERKSYLFGQQQSVFAQRSNAFSGETKASKQRGEDTRDREYISAVTNRQNETSKQVFELNQQRDAIKGMTPEAIAARESIDGLVAGLYEVEKIDLSNLTNEFDRFNQLLGETQKTTTNVLEKFVKTGKFDWKALLRTPLEGGISQMMNQVVPNLFSGLYRKAPKTNNPELPNGISPTNSVDDGIGFVGNLFGFGGKSASNLSEKTPEYGLGDAAISPQVSQRSVTPRSMTSEYPIVYQSSQSQPQPQSQSKYTLDSYSVAPEQRVESRYAPVAPAEPQSYTRGVEFSQLNSVDPQIQPLQPQTIEPPVVTIEPLEPQTIPAPEIIDQNTPFDIRPLPMPGRNNIQNFKPKYNPSDDFVAPPMPKSQFEGKPGYVAPQQQSSLGGDALGLIASMFGGKGKQSSGITSLISGLGGLFGLSFADGGEVPTDSKFNQYRQGNDPIAQALKREGSDSIIAALTPGERVLTVSESRYYQAMFPKGIKNYADGGVVGDIKPIPLALDQRKIDNRGDKNEFNFNIDGSDAKQSGAMGKQQIKEFENAVTAVLLKQKRARTGLVPM